ncbi:MAG: hypothetical protein Q7U03_05570, partial [Syntrophales bacterium]|nr:hypothetical protein [Syntrophales bacterium]
ETKSVFIPKSRINKAHEGVLPLWEHGSSVTATRRAPPQAYCLACPQPRPRGLDFTIFSPMIPESKEHHGREKN